MIENMVKTHIMGKMNRFYISVILVSFSFFFQKSYSQDYIPTEANIENREWFQDAKFGLFVHWGVYSTLGVHEWVMQTQKIDKNTYEKISIFFNPIEFDAEEWVLLAKNAGMKYITITAKHHDGFAMFDSQLTNWDIIDRTNFKRDIIKEIADACRKHELKLFLYYSQLDWNNNDYYPRGNTGNSSGRPDNGNWENYLKYMNGQLKELLTNYGDIAGIWFDGMWDKKNAEWNLEECYQLIHSLQDQTLIGSNHHKIPYPGEDFQMFEKDLPGKNTAGYSGDAKIGNIPLETAETMAHRWGFSLQDKAYKSSKELIQYLVKAAGYNSNFLLNVGPMPNGKIQQEFVDTLKVIGKWTKKYGETIYGTRGGPIDPQTWGVTTQKDNKIYVHILDWHASSIVIPNIDKKIKSIIHFETQKPVIYQVNKFGISMKLSENFQSDLDTIIEIIVEDE